MAGVMECHPFWGGSNLVVVFFVAGNFLLRDFQTLQRVSMKFGLAIFAIEKSHDPCPMHKRILAKKTCWIPVGFIGWNSMLVDPKVLLITRLEQDLRLNGPMAKLEDMLEKNPVDVK